MALSWQDIETDKLSPMMQQYVAEKQRRPDCLLFFRLGDFYEMFFDDAVTASRELELTLTSRDCGLAERAPMAGVPHHSAEQYISRLTEKGYKIAICEQMEDPALAKGIVRREVVRIVTPGTVTDLSKVDERENNYLMAVCQQGPAYGIASADLTTGDFTGTQLLTGMTEAHVYDEIHRIKPAELLCNPTFFVSELADTLRSEHFYLTKLPEERFNKAAYADILPQAEFNQELLQAAAAALLYYIEDTQKQLPDHMKHLEVYEISQYMILGHSARRNLELVETLRDRKKKGSLLWVIDHCKTAMGSRLLRRWLEQPLIYPAEIEYRLDAVEALKEGFILRQELREGLSGMNDLQRLVGKLVLGNLNARDLASVMRSLAKIPALMDRLQAAPSPILQKLGQSLDPLEELTATLEKGLAEELPITLHEGGLIREGFDSVVDEYREAHEKGSEWILNLEAKEREATGIKNLKVGYNRVFGYYLEVTKSNLSLVPERYSPRQTLSNSQRYTVPELKAMEDKILNAERNLLDREYEVFCQLRDMTKAAAEIITHDAAVLAELDCFLSLAEVAERNHYVRPQITMERVIEIKAGRHAVVEKMLDSGAFVANDTSMDSGERRMILLTGPNMSGKSTYMRQIAQMVILAQMGAFVPADEAVIGICDQIFTRIGASDDLAGGQSTFMVEMSEVAHILQNATPDSLLILDEIGRGTSTYDGLSIAWAVIEHIADANILGARTLFATHYHELTDLEGLVPGIVNLHVAVQKREGERDIRFLHHIEAGAADESYGVEVARLAGVSDEVVERANDILYKLEQEGRGQAKRRVKPAVKVMEGQMDLFSSSLLLRQHDHIMERLSELDAQNMTPLEALREIYELSREAKQLTARKGGGNAYDQNT